MTTKQFVVNTILANSSSSSSLSSAQAFAPSNIALAKYWGKRDQILNLPMNSSLSISLANKGCQASVKRFDVYHIVINHQPVDLNTEHGQRLVEFLDLFSGPYSLNLQVNIPFAAGLASSACIFAAIIRSLNQLHEWELSNKALSMLARLGSGSASRSMEHGFVEWHKGERADGMDSFAEAIDFKWPELCIGICIVDSKKKSVGSRAGMLRTVETSPLYDAWPNAAERAVAQLKQAIREKDFLLLGKTAESNALAMHATMLSATPPLIYSTEQTLKQIQLIWKLRQQGLNIFFTQDAGPNLKLLFLQNDISSIRQHFDSIELVQPFKEDS